MGKTPKKAAPWGDERNLYRKLLKATSKTSETHSHNRQRESENLNRSKLTTQLRKVPPGQRKGFKNKVNTTVKFDSSCPTQQHSWVTNSPKKKKKSTENKGTESNSKMQPESEAGEINVDETSGNKSCAKPETSKESRASMEKHVDHAASEPVQTSSKEEEQQNGESEKDQTVTEKTEEKLNKSVESKQLEVQVEREEHEEVDLKLTLENEENLGKPQEENIGEEPQSKENEKIRIEVENRAQETDEVQSVSLNDTENTTAELTESLKSSDSTEVNESTSQNEERNERDKEEETATEKEQTFVSYDPAIMLKDVQIKLNDCMKESSSKMEASTADQQTEQEQDLESLLPPRPSDDLSFGKTLRNISGRRSLGRMRHVTIREQRYSPNNSMFVNTSGTSLMPDDNEDFKILRYNTGVSETISASNGSSIEKKRKHENIEDRASKKQKTETENMLTTSISLLKGLRRPIQASTPVAELKFQSNKLDLLDDERDKSVNDHQATKKWCAVM